MPQLVATIMPLPQTMKDNDLVPEGSLRLDGGDVCHLQIQAGYILCNIRVDRGCDVWVER